MMILLLALSLISPFAIDFSPKKELTNEDYIEVQRQISALDITPLVKKLHYKLDRTGLFSLQSFLWRCSRGITSNLIDPENGLYPEKGLIKIGRGGDRCFVCYASLNGKYPDYIKSLITGLEEQNFNGYILYYIGGWPNPTGEEIQYAAVPYSFKIFAMEEAHLLGFNNVLWIDSAFLPINDVEPLFDLINKNGVLLCWWPPNGNGRRSILPQTREILLQITGTDVLRANYISAPFFGLKMNTPEARQFIQTYLQCVKIGTPFLSCFPEEWVFTAIAGKKEFRRWRDIPAPFLFRINNVPEEMEMLRQAGLYFYYRKER